MKQGRSSASFTQIFKPFLDDGNDQDIYNTSVIQRINCFKKAGLFCLFLTSSSFSRQIMVHCVQQTMAPSCTFLSSNNTYQVMFQAKVHCIDIALLNRTQPKTCIIKSIDCLSITISNLKF